nr:HAD family hydrolase [Pseudalkalibacillus decolorationis]
MDYYLNERLYAKDKRLKKDYDLNRIFSEQVVCLTFIHRREKLEEFYHQILEEFGSVVEVHLFENLYSPGWYWFQIHDKKATKDQAIRTLQQQYGVSDYQLTVFGDEINDIKMFKIADRAIAVSNAKGALMEVATQFIGTNEEDSVIKFIMKDHDSRRNQEQKLERIVFD